VDAFSHVARWNDVESRIEMHPEVARDVHFSVAGRLFSMASGETIHTENSLKYDARVARVLRQAGGWIPIADWTDQKKILLTDSCEWQRRRRTTSTNERSSE
jgi:uncharacterized SAM-dependent methyltransferase